MWVAVGTCITCAYWVMDELEETELVPGGALLFGGVVIVLTVVIFGATAVNSSAGVQQLTSGRGELDE